MRNFIIAAGAALLLSGCVSSYKTFDSTGKEASYIRCPLLQPHLCYQEAEKECPSGYAVIGQESGVNIWDSNRSITVTCKKK